MLCECGTLFHPKTNQKRCSLCIELKPHRGRHAAGKLGEKYVKQAKIRLMGVTKHWNISMGTKALKTMFPDLVPHRDS
jgi:hypothetical protein